MISLIKNKKAYTLLEVIIALAIILIVGASFTKVYYTSVKVSLKEKERLEALVTAQNYLEEIRGGRDEKKIKDISTLLDYINKKEGEGFILDGNTLKNSKEPQIIIYYNEEVKDSFFEVIISVKKKDLKEPVLVGTKFFIEK